MSGSKASWLAREGVPSVSLAAPRTPVAVCPPRTPVPFLRREDVTPAMEAAVRQVARAFPGARIRIEGVLRPIRAGEC